MKPNRPGTGRPKGQAKSGGRVKGVPNKATTEIRALAQQYGENAILKLAGMMNRCKDNDIVVRCAQILLDRGYGRPAQAIHHADHEGGPLRLHDMGIEELKALATRLEHTLALPEVASRNAGDD